MKNLEMFIQTTCPHCKRALQWQKELIEENPLYAAVPIRIIDERAEADYANSKDYYFVPTYYADNVKVHEGIPTKEKIKEVFEEALK